MALAGRCWRAGPATAAAAVQVQDSMVQVAAVEKWTRIGHPADKACCATSADQEGVGGLGASIPAKPIGALLRRHPHNLAKPARAPAKLPSDGDRPPAAAVRRGALLRHDSEAGTCSSSLGAPESRPAVQQLGGRHPCGLAAAAGAAAASTGAAATSGRAASSGGTGGAASGGGRRPGQVGAAAGRRVSPLLGLQVCVQWALRA